VAGPTCDVAACTGRLGAGWSTWQAKSSIHLPWMVSELGGGYSPAHPSLFSSSWLWGVVVALTALVAVDDVAVFPPIPATGG